MLLRVRLTLRALLVTAVLLGFWLPTLARTSVEEHLRGIKWEAFESEAVELMQEYLRIDTSNPPGNELAAAEFLHRLFEAAGIPNTIFNYAPGRADIYAVLKGDGTLRPLVLLNHLDVVRADSRQWDVPPFSGEIVNGEIYGRGAVDMKDEGLLHAMVMLIATRERLPLKRDLIFLGTADEEVGDTGSAWLLQNHPELVREAEYLITEGGSNLIYPGRGTLYGIEAAEKVPLWVRMTATGRGGHGSVPIPGSAPNRLVKAMKRVVDWQTPTRLIPSVEQYFHQIAVLEDRPRSAQFRNIRRALADPAFARALAEDESFNYLLHDTVAITVFKAGSQTNVIPDTASCDLDVRLLPGEDPESFLAQLRAVVADERVHIEPISRFRPPNSSPTDTDLFRLIERVVHEFNAEALVTPTLDGGYTESQMYRPLGIICYGFSPIEITSDIDIAQHAANERVPVEQIRRGVRLLYEVVARAANQ